MSVNVEAAGRLARRLRELRKGRATQSHLARALGVSAALISSWEKPEHPTTPPEDHLKRYARFFATERSIEGGHPRLLTDDELTPEESRRRRELEAELTTHRATILGTAGSDEYVNRLRASPGAALLRYPRGEPITVVCGASEDESAKPPFTNPATLGFVRSHAYADRDAVIEMYGHLRAVNPDNPVRIKVANDLSTEDWGTHLVLIGGIDYNGTTRQVIDRVGVPVRQLGRPQISDLGGFLVDDGSATAPLVPELSSGVLVRDVGQFLRAPNFHNKARTLTVCHAAFAAGTYGVVLAVTDARVRDQNAEYQAQRFGAATKYSILMSVHVTAGEVETPVWSESDSRLHEWPGPGPASG